MTNPLANFQKLDNKNPLLKVVYAFFNTSVVVKSIVVLKVQQKRW